MIDIAERIRALAPTAEDGDWLDVARRAGSPRRKRRRIAVVAAAAAVALVAVLGVVELTSRGRVGIVDRALAAVSTGPVIHAVMTINQQDLVNGPATAAASRLSIIDLATGAERPVLSTYRLWYDPDHRLARATTTIDGLPVWDSFDTKRGRQHGPFDPALSAFVTGYREALASGRAVSAGRDVIEGQAVQWLWFPGPVVKGQHRSGSEVGLDPATGKALFYRGWCPRCPEPIGPMYRIETLAGVQRSAMDFTSNVQHAAPARFGAGHGHTIPLRDANRLLGRTALWAGRAVAGIRFSLVQYRWSSRNSASPPTVANSISRGKGLIFLYGVHVQPDGRHYRPIPGAPSFAITVTPDAPDGPGNFFGYGLREPQTIAGGPVPVYDQVALSRIGWWDAQFRKDGLYVEISGPSKAIVLAAARAMKPLSR
jgi:hypothetical protein